MLNPLPKGHLSKIFPGKYFSCCCLRQWITFVANHTLTKILRRKSGEWDLRMGFDYSWKSRGPHAYSGQCTYSAKTRESPKTLSLTDVMALRKHEVKANAELSIAWLSVGRHAPKHTRGPSTKSGRFLNSMPLRQLFSH